MHMGMCMQLHKHSLTQTHMAHNLCDGNELSTGSHMLTLPLAAGFCGAEQDDHCLD